MGASQSSGGEEPAQGVKTSYYELLGVQRHATEEEIKKAYRRKALELHPDRNYGNEEHATKVFAEVQSAYEVLSDPQERAWYDSHESAILRGDDVDDEDGVPTYEDVRLTTADDLARTVRKFNSGVEFTDSPSGFFGFLRDLFNQLAREEEIAANRDDAETPEYPSFGHQNDSYEYVAKRFYTVWSSFSTVKNYSWKDKYRLSEAPDRWYRRRMEQENKKCRQDGVREFNDAVRSLVAFVRKRDPRYEPSTQTEEERQKVLRDAAAAQAARARAANEAKLNAEVPEWTKSREPDPLAEMEGTFDEEEEEEHVFECVACNKIFKSERQWEAHEKSKKHQKAVRALQQKMRKDDVRLDLDSAASGAATPNVREDEEEVLPVEILAEEEDHVIRTNGTLNAETRDEGLPDLSRHHEASERHAGVVEGDGKPVQPTIGSHADSEDDDYASPEAIQNRLAASTISQDDDQHDQSSDEAEEASNAPKKLGKAAQKRAKKAAATASSDGTDVNHKCVGCDAAFPTKSRLFQHLKDHPKHVAFKSGAEGVGGKKKGKPKR
ncbi:hypothetical protein BAUCODRAFT_368217 [Baudoinia panamericana UAMH 10762]|uniref:J domain-containing protein n=1 Tax=Baudoinia panamericana (strain UAMH 10762) TaxID=717646 RepID=M2NM12_BAUPA|nr:uncharacterized protein BAUCODRAFT_368217 [Baudoinia panamericana UAMH 10762]EMD00211.1 hypothetical protein BAUCODRAFT_368217 [Baudoinia panamericana UAMH 10762]